MKEWLNRDAKANKEKISCGNTLGREFPLLYTSFKVQNQTLMASEAALDRIGNQEGNQISAFLVKFVKICVVFFFICEYLWIVYNTIQYNTLENKKVHFIFFRTFPFLYHLDKKESGYIYIFSYRAHAFPCPKRLNAPVNLDKLHLNSFVLYLYLWPFFPLCLYF